jgi:hypothetical protein
MDMIPSAVPATSDEAEWSSTWSEEEELDPEEDGGSCSFVFVSFDFLCVWESNFFSPAEEEGRFDDVLAPDLDDFPDAVEDKAEEDPAPPRVEDEPAAPVSLPFFKVGGGDLLLDLLWDLLLDLLRE